MATTVEELKTAWLTYFRANIPDVTAADNAINLTTMAAVQGNDTLAFLLAQLIVNTRTSATPGYNYPLSAAQKKALYNELTTSVAALKGVIDTINTALAAYYATLP